MTDTTIQVGMPTVDTDEAYAVLNGATGSSVEGQEGDTYDRKNEAAVDLVNSMGGIAGRKVEPIYYRISTQSFVSSSARQQENQRACSRWTEDHHVFAFSAASLAEEVILECAARTKTPMVALRNHSYPSQRRVGAMSDYWYSTDNSVADRRERAVVSALRADGFFTKGAKVGLMIEDKPGIREGVERSLKPALAARGVRPATEIIYPDSIESPFSNYVLRLQAAGVTHVLWSAVTTPLGTLFMMRAAEEQRYRPAWGLGTDNWPALAHAVGAPREQLENVRAVGWKPSFDVGDGTPQSTNGQQCAAQMEKYGQNPADPIGLQSCEFLFFLKAAFDRADVVSAAGLATGVARMGGSYGSTLTIGGVTAFSRDRHDGPAIVRIFGFDRAKNQFVYRTDAWSMPD